MLRFLFFLLILVVPCFGEETEQGHVLVSIAPYKFFVEKIAGNTVDTTILVPPGVSSHTFEPTPKQVSNASHADVWFRIGEGFEMHAVAALKSHRPDMLIIDMREGVNLICGEGCHCHGHEGGDLHVWLSPKLVKKQAEMIAQILIKRYPEHANLYKQNLQQLLVELDALDQDIASMIQPLKKRTIMVSHPAYSYFTRDYQLRQLPIEFEGKDPSPRHLTQILNEAREAQVKIIFSQVQHSSKGAYVIAQELGGRVVMLDPYAENYLENMRSIAKQFASQ